MEVYKVCESNVFMFIFLVWEIEFLWNYKYFDLFLYINPIRKIYYDSNRTTNILL